jgi:hypothetical protein
MAFLDWIEQRLAEVGLEMTDIVSDTMVKIAAVKGGHVESIYVSQYGTNVDGHTIIKFTSEPIPLTGIEKTDGGMALYLLRRNAELTSTHWEIIDGEKTTADWFILGAVCIAKTLDPAELSDVFNSILDEKAAMAKALRQHSVDF